jgi:hypothetical protein
LAFIIAYRFEHSSCGALERGAGSLTLKTNDDALSIVSVAAEETLWCAFSSPGKDGSFSVDELKWGAMDAPFAHRG